MIRRLRAFLFVLIVFSAVPAGPARAQIPFPVPTTDFMEIVSQAGEIAGKVANVIQNGVKLKALNDIKKAMNSAMNVFNRVNELANMAVNIAATNPIAVAKSAVEKSTNRLQGIAEGEWDKLVKNVKNFDEKLKEDFFTAVRDADSATIEKAREKRSTARRAAIVGGYSRGLATRMAVDEKVETSVEKIQEAMKSEGANEDVAANSAALLEVYKMVNELRLMNSSQLELLAAEAMDAERL